MPGSGDLLTPARFKQVNELASYILRARAWLLLPIRVQRFKVRFQLLAVRIIASQLIDPALQIVVEPSGESENLLSFRDLRGQVPFVRHRYALATAAAFGHPQ